MIIGDVPYNHRLCLAYLFIRITLSKRIGPIIVELALLLIICSLAVFEWFVELLLRKNRQEKEMRLMEMTMKWWNQKIK
jgi:hypothetical protein